MFHRFSCLIIALCCLACCTHAQDITGLWKGTLYNDSTQQNLRYEIAISENKNGKLSGYTHTFFMVDDKEYYGVKKVKIRRADDGKIVIQTEELIANNYPIPPAKGIYQVDVLTLEMNGDVMTLSGPFTTNRTKKYASLTGNIKVQRKQDYRQSALVPHLEELGLAKDLSFVPKEAEVKPTLTIPVEISTPPVVKVKTKKEPVKEPVKEPNKNVEPVKIIPIVTGPAADVNKRKTENIQSVNFKSDSLVLTLYDNGEVDGDTVTVLLNGKVIMPMQGLSTKAIRKTLYTKDMPDSLQLIMYAENLGSIPPNTGLLVVHDGDDIYEIRFSGDFQKNAAIVFKRKK